MGGSPGNIKHPSVASQGEAVGLQDGGQDGIKLANILLSNESITKDPLSFVRPHFEEGLRGGASVSSKRVAQEREDPLGEVSRSEEIVRVIVYLEALADLWKIAGAKQ